MPFADPPKSHFTLPKHMLDTTPMAERLSNRLMGKNAQFPSILVYKNGLLATEGKHYCITDDGDLEYFGMCQGDDISVIADRPEGGIYREDFEA